MRPLSLEVPPQVGAVDGESAVKVVVVEHLAMHQSRNGVGMQRGRRNQSHLAAQLR